MPPPPDEANTSSLSNLRSLLQDDEAALADADPLLQQFVAFIRSAPMQDDWRDHLPQPLRDRWSAVELVLERHRNRPLSLSGLRREVHKVALSFAISRKRRQRVSPRSLTPPWWDVKGMVGSYLEAIRQSHPGLVYDKSIPCPPKPHTNFNLVAWYEEHRRHCPHCRDTYPSFATFCAANRDNPCYFSHIFAWLHGLWRIPLVRPPPSGIYIRAFITNRSSRSTLTPTQSPPHPVMMFLRLS